MYRGSTTLVLAVITLLAVGSAAAADGTSLFRSVPAPSSFTGRHAATFVSIDADVFASARTLPDDVTLRFEITLPEIGRVRVVAARYRVIDQTTTVTAMTANGPRPAAPPQSVLLRGRIEGMPESFVVMAVYSSWATGRIAVGRGDAERIYRMSPLDRSAPSAPMVIFNEADVPSSNDWNCATADPAEIRIPAPKHGEATQALQYRQIRIAIECDEPFFIDHGRDLTRATEYAEAVVAASSAIYERDVDATLLITQLTVWTTVDPYPATTSDGMLVQFRDRWRALNGGVSRALAHLLSGVNNIGGIAYVDQLCKNQWGYAVSGTNNNVNYPAAGYVWDTDVFSHELGHNIGSPHTHSCSWAPAIDSCVAAEGGSCYTGTKPRKGTIMSYCHLTTFGTDLSFHPRVVSLMQSKLLNNACTPLISFFTVDLPTSFEVCSGGAVSATADVEGGTGRITYRWTGGGYDTVTQSATYVFNPTSTFTLRVTATDSLGNSVVDSSRITVNPRPMVRLDYMTDRVCPGTPVEVMSTVSGGRAPYRYRWTQNGVVIDTVAEVTYPVIDRDAVIRLFVTDQVGCTDTAEVRIDVPDHRVSFDPPSAVFPPLPVCATDLAAALNVRNEGTESVVIDSVRSARGLKLRVAAPFVVPVNNVVPVDVEVALPSVGMVDDTLIFISTECGNVYRWSYRATRSGMAVLSALPIDFGAHLVCTEPVMHTAGVRIDNRSESAIRITALEAGVMDGRVALVEETPVIPARSERTVLVRAAGRRIAGADLDSLRFSYESASCEGTITVPTSLRTIGMTIDHPVEISFDTVGSNAAVQLRSFTVSTALVGASRVVVASVDVDGPFTTTLASGSVLAHSKATPFVARLDPSQLTRDGLIEGAIRFRIDSCTTERVVRLRANVRTVSVDEELPAVDGQDDAVIALHDLRGACVWTGTMSALRSDRASVSPGVYVYILRNGTEVRTGRFISR